MSGVKNKKEIAMKEPHIPLDLCCYNKIAKTAVFGSIGFFCLATDVNFRASSKGNH